MNSHTWIGDAFKKAIYPGDDNLVATMSDEALLTRKAFLGKQRWEELDSEFLDRAPSGLGSALSFLSDIAFRFYLPAFLRAHLNHRLHFVDPCFHVCPYMDDLVVSFEGQINWELIAANRRFQRFKYFTSEECCAIARYIEEVMTREGNDDCHLENCIKLWNATARLRK